MRRGWQDGFWSICLQNLQGVDDQTEVFTPLINQVIGQLGPRNQVIWPKPTRDPSTKLAFQGGCLCHFSKVFVEELRNDSVCLIRFG